MKIRRINSIETQSLLRKFPGNYDYCDSFKLTLAAPLQATPDDILAGIWLDMPAWVEGLFTLRNFLVRFVGLKGGKPTETKEFEKCIREGKSSEFFEIPAKDNTETVMLLKDKHLSAYLSVRKPDAYNVSMNTLVFYNNNLGKIYFFFIRPFHNLILKSCLKRVAKSGVCRQK